MKFLPLLLVVSLFLSCEKKVEDEQARYPTPFETSNGNQTPTYGEIIDFYIHLAKEFPEINLQTIGDTDSGYPLHLVTYNPDGEFNFGKIGKDKLIMLVNNGIHPGESDGIDATMLLYRDLAVGKIAPPKKTVIASIPVYNIGGALNRNNTTRANQNGPERYGFRGNAQNYDLNRDFIKMDTKNAATFAQIFHLVKPDIFVDNHVSNGADYQYTLTHLITQHNKMGGPVGEYLEKGLRPKLEKGLADAKWDITPYVNVFNKVPESGFSQFFDSPRYSTGYTTLWNTLGMMVETHMLKPYEERVKGTYELMKIMIGIAETDHKNIKEMRANAHRENQQRKTYTLRWELDTTKTTTLNFKGFEADTLISEVTGLPRLKYDRKRPFQKKVAYRNSFKPSTIVAIPQAYIIKKGWHRVMERLQENQISYSSLPKDTVLKVESYKIRHYDTAENPFEGHYPHSGTKVAKRYSEVQFSAGDYLVPTDQVGIRYLLETLEPEATDSFFNWNFFDPILSRKEGFSPYVFEDIASQILKENESLNTQFRERQQSDADFAANWYAQLEWIYKKSGMYEAAHMQYPVYRLLRSDTSTD